MKPGLSQRVAPKKEWEYKVEVEYKYAKRNGAKMRRDQKIWLLAQSGRESSSFNCPKILEKRDPTLGILQQVFRLREKCPKVEPTLNIH